MSINIKMIYKYFFSMMQWYISFSVIKTPLETSISIKSILKIIIYNIWYLKNDHLSYKKHSMIRVISIINKSFSSLNKTVPFSLYFQNLGDLKVSQKRDEIGWCRDEISCETEIKTRFLDDFFWLQNI